VSSPPLDRSFPFELEAIRSSKEGRTIAGIVVPYGVEATVSDGGPAYREMFELGCAAKTIAERGNRVKLLSQHNSRQNPLGRAIMLREDKRGLYGEFTVSRTQAGDEVLELCRDGALDSFSIGFTPVKHEKRNGVVVRKEIAIREASIVTAPAYEDARIEAIRAAAILDLVRSGYTPNAALDSVANAFAEISDGDHDAIRLGLILDVIDGLPVEELLRVTAESVRGTELDPDLVDRVVASLLPAKRRPMFPATTADGQPERTVTEPASATQDVVILNQFRAAKAAARMKGILP